MSINKTFKDIEADYGVTDSARDYTEKVIKFLRSPKKKVEFLEALYNEMIRTYSVNHQIMNAGDVNRVAESLNIIIS